MKKLLTVAIPSYNRADTLYKTVLFFIKNILKNNLQDEVILLVSDNASPDKTWTYLKEIKQRYPLLINIHRQDSNLGYAKNVLWLLNNCTSKYIWTIGDDDIYKEETLLTIISNLEKNIDVLFLNCEYPSNSTYKLGREVTQEYKGTLEEIISIPNDQVTYMSCNVVKTDLIKISPYTSDNWILADKIIHLHPKCKAKFLPHPFVRYSSADIESNWLKNPLKTALFSLEFLRLLIVEKDNPLLKEWGKQSANDFADVLIRSLKQIGIENTYQRKYIKYLLLTRVFAALSILLLLCLCIILIW